MKNQERMLEVSKELKGVKDEIKFHRDEFNESVEMLTHAKDALEKENKRLRELITQMGVEDEESLMDGLSVSYRNDFIIEDEFAVTWEYMTPDLAKIRKELVDSEWTKPIGGVRVIKKPTLRVSSK